MKPVREKMNGLLADHHLDADAPTPPALLGSSSELQFWR